MTYLEKLRALETKKAATPAPTKPTEVPREPTKAPFVGSVGSPPTPLKNIRPSAEPSAERADRAAESRRQRALAMLERRPDIDIAAVCDGHGDPVPVAVAIRGKGACEVHIPAASFDPFSLLELIDRNGATLQ